MELFLREVVRIVAGDARLVYLADTMILGSILISILLLLRPWLGKLSRAGMYMLWIAVGLRILIPVNLFNFFPEEIRDDVSAVTEQLKVQGIERQFQMDELNSFGGRDNGYRLFSNRPKEVLSEENGAGDEKSSYTASREAAETFLEVVGTVWALGVIFLVIYMLESLLWIRLRLCDAKQIDENVYTHPLIHNSFVVGFCTPRIYLSEQVAASDRRYVICHENVHIKRCDYRIKPIMFLLCSVFWMNPLMWAAYHCMIEDMEISCDEAVLRRFGEHRKKEYSMLLLRMSAASNGYRGQYVSFSKGKVKRRIWSVLHYREYGKIVYALGVILIGCAVGAIVSVPGASAVDDRVTLAKDVYVEQSYNYSEISDYYSDELLQQVKDRNEWRKQWDEKLYVGEGDGFYVMLEREGDLPDALVIYDLVSGREKYHIPVSSYIKETADKAPCCRFQAGVTDKYIYFVCDQGIFEVKYGRWDVVKKVSSKTDNVYYLGDTQSEYRAIIRGKYGGYYVTIRRNGKQQVCHYKIQEVWVK